MAAENQAEDGQNNDDTQLQNDEIDETQNNQETALEADMNAIKQSRNGSNNISENKGSEEQEMDQEMPIPKVEIVTKPTVIEDFIRNFLISNSMHNTLDIFQREWYDKQQNMSIINSNQSTLQTEIQINDANQTITVQNETDIMKETNETSLTNITNNNTYNPARIESELIEINNIPDIYFQKQELEEKVRKLDKELNRMETVVDKVRNTWDQLRKERDFHRMHHRRVVQEKNSLIKQLKRLKKYCDSYEPTIQALKTKYESAMKEKMLMRIDRDKIAVKLETMEEQLKSMQETYATHNNAHSSHALSRTDFISSNSNNINKKSSSKSSRKKRSSQLSQTQKENINTFLHPNHLINNNTKNASNVGDNGDNGVSSQSKATPYPSNNYENPYLSQDFETINVESFSMSKTCDAHKMAISRIVLHPTKDIICTVSDDMTWKLWNLPDCELIMSGDGHKDWLSDCSFHPSGAILVTSSGDATMKLWDFQQSKCIYTWDEFTNQKTRLKYQNSEYLNSLHSQAIWSVDFHHTNGNFMISSSMDHTCKLWDLGKQIDMNPIRNNPNNSYKCRQTYRGHVDSVNYCLFQPFSNNIVTASGDKTISFWDIKSGLCVQTFYGHTNSVNHISFNIKGDIILSCDSDGICKLFDIRMIRELKSIDTGKLVSPCNEARFDVSGKEIVVASEDGIAKVFDTQTAELKGSLPGHTEGINSLLFTHDYSMLATAGADGTVRLWQ